MYNYIIHPNWIPREENTITDDQSKLWASTRALFITPQTHSQIRTNLNTIAVIIFPEYGQLSLFFRQRASRMNNDKTVVVIHPIWPRQPWWPLLLDLRSKHTDLGPFTNFINRAHHKMQGKKPYWMFTASLLSVP